MRADDPLGIGADDPKCMAGGAILDPNDGKIYQLSATCEPDRTLHARIFKDILLFGNIEALWHGGPPHATTALKRRAELIPFQHNLERLILRA